MIHDSPRAATSPGRARVVALETVQARLIAAARALVAEQGWPGAHIALIAARAGVATGTVYRHFASKADLFAHVLADVSTREIANVERLATATGTADRRLHQAVTSFMHRALAGRRLAYALIAEPCESEIDRERLVYRAALAGVFQQLVADGITTRRFRAVSPATAASCIAGAMMEALVGPLAPHLVPESAPASKLVRETADLCVAMVRRP